MNTTQEPSLSEIGGTDIVRAIKNADNLKKLLKITKQTQYHVKHSVTYVVLEHITIMKSYNKSM